MIVKKLTKNNLLTIKKGLLLRVPIDKVPLLMTRQTFPQYYYYMYKVEKKSKRVIEITIMDNPDIDVKQVSTPKIIKKSISDINLHIPSKIANDMTDTYFEFKVTKNGKIQLIGISKEEYLKHKGLY